MSHMDECGHGFTDLTHAGAHKFTLLDTVRPGGALVGGTRKTINWALAANLVVLASITLFRA
jgi:hypothetical protein